MSIADLLLMELNTMEKTKPKNMNIIKALLKELDSEFNTTKKFIVLVPTGKFDWAPHEKSMKMKTLVSHIAELPEWISMALTLDGLDFATTPYEEKKIESNDDLLKLSEACYQTGRSELEKADEECFEEKWMLRNGEQILAEYTRYETIRHTLSQIIHHWAQLGVYLRLLNIPIPGSYGPSADDQNF